MRVAVTGAGGLVGGVLRDGMDGRFACRWLSHADADITDLEALRRAFTDVDAVVHLAADASVSAPWDEIIGPNLIGAYNAYEAARLSDVRRFVFASSNHVMGRYLWDDARFANPEQPTVVPVDAPVRPDTLYGASKAWGEALGRFYAERYGLSVVCLRIGWVTDDDRVPSDVSSRTEPPDVAARAPAMWLSHADCVSLVEAALTADVDYATAYGVSDNTGRWFSLDEGRRLLGWEPRSGARV